MGIRGRTQDANRDLYLCTLGRGFKCLSLVRNLSVLGLVPYDCGTSVGRESTRFIDVQTRERPALDLSGPKFRVRQRVFVHLNRYGELERFGATGVDILSPSVSGMTSRMHS